MAVDDFPAAGWDFGDAYCARKADGAGLQQLGDLLDKPVVLPTQGKKRKKASAGTDEQAAAVHSKKAKSKTSSDEQQPSGKQQKKVAHAQAVQEAAAPSSIRSDDEGSKLARKKHKAAAEDASQHPQRQTSRSDREGGEGAQLTAGPSGRQSKRQRRQATATLREQADGGQAQQAQQAQLAQSSQQAHQEHQEHLVRQQVSEDADVAQRGKRTKKHKAAAPIAARVGQELPAAAQVARSSERQQEAGAKAGAPGLTTAIAGQAKQAGAVEEAAKVPLDRRRQEEELKQKLRQKWERRKAAKAAKGSTPSTAGGTADGIGQQPCSKGPKDAKKIAMTANGAGIDTAAGTLGRVEPGGSIAGVIPTVEATPPGRLQGSTAKARGKKKGASAGSQTGDTLTAHDGNNTSKSAGRASNAAAAGLEHRSAPARAAEQAHHPAPGAGAAGLQSRVMPVAGAAPGATSVIGKMMAKLQGGRFRSLNEQLYTTSGDDALAMMQQTPELFHQYHEGFQQQTLGWPKQPVDVAAKWLASLPASLVVADLGCGDAKLMRSVKQKVHSFDLVSSAPGVIACNMAQVPLEDSSIDAAVFSLALMGTDYGSFLAEACRVLKPKGWLWIAEVRSRFSRPDGKEDFKPFLSCLAKLGFKLQRQDAGNKMFVTWILRKDPQQQQAVAEAIQWPTLKACVYKRR